MRQSAPEKVRKINNTPVSSDVPPSGATVRLSAQRRAQIHPRICPNNPLYSFSPTHTYVATYWNPVLGNSALEEMLRLIAAAKHGWSIPLPVFLPFLAQEGLIHFGSQAGTPQPPIVRVHQHLPLLNKTQLSRLPYNLRVRHKHDLVSILGPDRLASSYGHNRPPTNPTSCGIF